ncbi:enoyl-CoA hydratase [Rhizorhabdus dicambivorans]|uniref:Enoyl-CoA hydratase n=3 Tax=Rhizorhabdus dicambivorans TaxID=1850238 RepID=A0A2A4FSG8_9SPHN|nr:enoyl-CoA hydratase [Rhizorhabdus dicambivorans]PCE41363.1 enoyl-CoA hydratase [Rhizorhabdus dicambivorans]
MGEGPDVLVDRMGHVMIVTINRPEVRNCVNLAVHLGIGEALEEAERDPHIRALILTGAGDKAFCAGADLKALARGEPIIPHDPAKAAWGFAGYVRHHISKPTIAAVIGSAFGGGTELTLASDLAIAADTAQFGLPEVKRGIIAAAGGAFRMVQQLPRKIGMELLLTGNAISADRALVLGLVNAVVPARAVMDEALRLADCVAANAPLAVQATKRTAQGIHDGRIDSEQASWEASRREAALVWLSEDAKEGPVAFAEKRAPVWQGR